jgi:hypothetical protein
MEFKICSKCQNNKPISEFTVCSRNKDGLYHQCKTCKNSARDYENINRNRLRYDVSVTEKQCRICQQVKPSGEFSKHALNKDGLKSECKACVKEYNEKHKDYINKRNYEYFKEKGVHLQRINRANRRKTDPLYKLKCTIRSRTRSAFKSKGFKKNTKTEKMLGCDWNTSKQHLERQFTKGMSWDNHGEWHIDHIIPLSSAKSVEELTKLAHYTNLQPLWAKDNLSKGSQIIY